MKKHEFYSKYANTPLDDRIKPLNIIKLPPFAIEHELKNLYDLYQEINRVDEEMRPLEEEMNDLLIIADQFL